MPNGEDAVRAAAVAIEREGLPWRAGPTTLSSLPPEEQRKRLGLVVTPAEQQRLAAERDRVAGQERSMLSAAQGFGAPGAVDWRNVGGQSYVTPIKDQGPCGSCVSFCSCATIESAVRIKLGNPTYAVDLSEAFLQFCGGGSCCGWGLTSGLEAAKTMGVTDNACMPYQLEANPNKQCVPFDDFYIPCATRRCSDWQNRLTKISSYAGYSTMAARKDALATKGPLLAGMAVFNDFYSYTSGVYVKTAGAAFQGNHCICVVGYDDNQQCWILKNSWGTGWGESGFCRLRYGQADLLIDTSWMMYSVDVQLSSAWQSNVVVDQVYATRDAQNAWAYFQGLGWRKIQPGTPDGVSNMLVLFSEARAYGRPVTINADASGVYEAYLL